MAHRIPFVSSKRRLLALCMSAIGLLVVALFAVNTAQVNEVEARRRLRDQIHVTVEIEGVKNPDQDEIAAALEMELYGKVSKKHEKYLKDEHVQKDRKHFHHHSDPNRKFEDEFDSSNDVSTKTKKESVVDKLVEKDVERPQEEPLQVAQLEDMDVEAKEYHRKAQKTANRRALAASLESRHNPRLQSQKRQNSDSFDTKPDDNDVQLKATYDEGRLKLVDPKELHKLTAKELADLGKELSDPNVQSRRLKSNERHNSDSFDTRRDDTVQLKATYDEGKLKLVDPKALHKLTAEELADLGEELTDRNVQ